MKQLDITQDLIDEQNNLKENIQEQSKLCKDLECMNIPYNQLIINGTFTDGNKMLTSVAKTNLKLFNAICDNCINKLTLNNVDKTILNIQAHFNKINENLQIFDIEILEKYLALKIDQCYIQSEILFYQKKQKEIEKSEKEIIKEQLKEEKQIQKEKEKLEREKISLQYKFNKQLEQTGIKDGNLQRDIESLESQISQNEYALTHNRAGYVYVVSNDDMKDGQYKIGITRRDIQERMKELGSGASHSFGMNLHGYVYCDDCFEVETKLHQYFAKSRVNQVNPRKEWFKTTLGNIKQAFKELFDIDIILTDISDENYLYSQGKVSI